VKFNKCSTTTVREVRILTAPKLTKVRNTCNIFFQPSGQGPRLKLLPQVVAKTIGRCDVYKKHGKVKEIVTVSCTGQSLSPVYHCSLAILSKRKLLLIT